MEASTIKEPKAKKTKKQPTQKPEKPKKEEIEKPKKVRAYTDYDKEYARSDKGKEVRKRFEENHPEYKTFRSIRRRQKLIKKYQATLESIKEDTELYQKYVKKIIKQNAALEEDEKKLNELTDK